MLRYYANLKAIRYESTILNGIVADKSHRVIVASDKLSGTGSVRDLACLIKLLTASESDGTTADVLPEMTGFGATFVRFCIRKFMMKKYCFRLTSYWITGHFWVRRSSIPFTASRAGLRCYLSFFVTPATFTF